MQSEGTGTFRKRNYWNIKVRLIRRSPLGLMMWRRGVLKELGVLVAWGRNALEYT